MSVLDVHTQRAVEAVERGEGIACDYCLKSHNQCGRCTVPDEIDRLVEARKTGRASS